jgi:hypothetical protein
MHLAPAFPAGLDGVDLGPSERDHPAKGFVVGLDDADLGVLVHRPFVRELERFLIPRLGTWAAHGDHQHAGGQESCRKNQVHPQ